MPAITHPDRDQLKAFGLGRLRPEDMAAIEEHVGQCDSCCQTLANVKADTLLDLARAAALTPMPAEFTLLAELPPELAEHPRYRVLAPIGEGGMGMVFKAEHKVMGRTVALKVISRELTANPQAVERFRREVKAAAHLNHPNIVTAYDAEEAGGLHFLVMEYVEGVSLDRYVARRGPLAVAMACHCARQVAMGLQHAHLKGLVHRDIKPHNLMITRKGQVKILDFGLARLGEDSRTRPGMTAPNLVMGTPDYLAPEQARDSHAVDIRADLYALGCTMYFLLTGRVPFPGDSAFDKMVAKTEREPDPVTKWRSDIPAEVVAVVHRLMARRPNDRYATPAEVATALAPLAKSSPAPLSDLPAPAPVPAFPAETPSAAATMPLRPPRKKKFSKRRRGPNWGLLIASGAVLLVLGMLVWAGMRFLPDWLARTTSFAGAAGSTRANSGLPTPAGRTGVMLFVVPSNGLYVDDFEQPRKALESMGYTIRIASSQKARTCSTVDNSLQLTSESSTVRPSLVLKEVHAADFDAVLFAGGLVDEFIPTGAAGDDAKRIIDEMASNGRTVGAICTGQRVLLAHGCLFGKEAAPPGYNFWYVKKGLDERQIAQEVSWQKTARVVRSGPYVTASGPEDGKQFAEKIVSASKN